MPEQRISQAGVGKWRSLVRSNGALLALLSLFVALSIATPNFLSTYNLLNIARQCSVNLILAVGMTMIILTGGIDLSIGGVLALVGTFVAGFLSGGMPLWLALTIGLLMGVGFGLFTGICVTKGKIPPFVATLGVLTISRSISLIYSGGIPITGMPTSFTFIGGGYVSFLPTPVVIAAVVFGLGLYIVNSSVLGRYVYAI